MNCATDRFSPLAGRPRTRCAALSPAWAITVLLLFGLALTASIATAPPASQVTTESQSAAEADSGDLALYRGISAQVRAGGDYYAVAIEAQRKGHYPTRPFFTVRLPTLTWLIATVSPIGAQAILLLLVLATTKAWLDRLLPPPHVSRFRFLVTVLVIGAGMAPAAIKWCLWFSENWAGLLIALSLALYRPNRWWPSVLVALAAVLCRELALLYLLAMCAIAVIAGRRSEAIGWGCAVLVFAVAFSLHASAVLALTDANDPASQGWYRFGGWPLFVAACQELTLLTVLPPLAVATLLPLSCFGLAAWNSTVALPTVVTIGSYTLLIAIGARPDNTYWIWMVNPILLLGLPLAPTALGDLIGCLRPHRPSYGHARHDRWRANG